jgi:hypothetical protein
MSKHNAALSLPLGDRPALPAAPGQDAAASSVAERSQPTKLEQQWERISGERLLLKERIARDRKRHHTVFRDEDKLKRLTLAQMFLERKIEQQRTRRHAA